MSAVQRYNKILFVCTGNTCRSPMAETIFRSLQMENGIHSLSRGIVVLFPEPSNPKAETVVASHGLKLENHIATQLDRNDMDEATLTLTMTTAQKNKIMNDFGITNNIYTIKEFVDEEGEVVDPYGGDLVDYENCYTELFRLAKKVTVKLNEEV